MTRAVDREEEEILGIVFVTGMFAFNVSPYLPVAEDTFSYARYQHYVQLLEPAASRACIKCCDNLDDCPTKMGTRLKSYLSPSILKRSYRSIRLYSSDSWELF